MRSDLSGLKQYRRLSLAAVFHVRRLQTGKHEHPADQKILGIQTNLQLLVGLCSKAERKLGNAEPESRQLAS